MQNFAGKKWVSLCSANAWIGTHATFPVIPKRCCRFLVVQSFQFEFATHQTSDIPTSVIVSPCSCDLFVSKVKKITRYMDVHFWRSFFCAFSVCVDCILKSTTAWLLKLSVLYIRSFMQVHNTTFQIKTVFNNVLFSTEVHNPWQVHLLALSYTDSCGS